MDLLEVIEQGLRNVSFSDDLGDRREYVGASDVGQCPRKAVSEKFSDEPYDLATLFRFARGHIAEKLVFDALENQSHLLPRWRYQKEVKHMSHPYRAHIDFLFTTRDTLGVLEVKTVDGLPSQPYDGWLQQLHFQMGLLKDHHPSKAIRGAVLAMDLNKGQIALFNGYEYSSELYEGLLVKASHIWDCMSNGTEARAEKSPICAWCRYRPDCPAYVPDEDIPSLSLERELEEYQGLKETQRDLKGQIEKLAQMFRAGIENANPDGDRIRVGENVVRRSVRTITRIDAHRLQKDLPDIHAKYTTETTYEVLVVE